LILFLLIVCWVVLQLGSIQPAPKRIKFDDE